MSLPDSSDAGGSLSSSSWRNLRPPPPSDRTFPDDSDDEDSFTVPDVELGPIGSGKDAAAGEIASSDHGGGALKLRRGRNPADREYGRLKRLLRNRESAQQARERKKIYVNAIEFRAQELNDKNMKLEEKISTLVNENAMLRKVLMNTRPKVDDSTDLSKDN